MRLSLLTAVCGNRVKVLSLVVGVRLLLVLGSSWRFLTCFSNCAVKECRRVRLAALWVVVLGGVQSNVSTNHAKIMILEPRGTQNQPKGYPGALRKTILEVGRQYGQPIQLDLGLFGATWAISDAILDPAGRQGGGKYI